jgi:hypothetical protein
MGLGLLLKYPLIGKRLPHNETRNCTAAVQPRDVIDATGQEDYAFGYIGSRKQQFLLPNGEKHIHKINFVERLK